MNSNANGGKGSRPTLRHRIHEVIFEADTFGGLAFDILLLIGILLSVIVVCLETVDSLKDRYGELFWALEWVFTILFTIEYLLRLYCVKRPMKYATSFFGVIDLLAVMPTYIGVLFVNAPHLAVVRAFRLLRVFRIFKLMHFMKESDELGRAIMRARAKIIVFLGVVVVSITVAGTLMYEIENWGSGTTLQFSSEDERSQKIALLRTQLENALEQDDYARAESSLGQLQESQSDFVKSKFTNIPQSMYWATVTMTTVGYGDIVPTTTLGKFVAAILILLGYSLIIVPTGFVSAEFIQAKTCPPSTQSCQYCMLESHDMDAIYCKRCGKPINEEEMGD